MGAPRATQAASREPAARGSAGRSAAEGICGTTGAAMRRSANRLPPGAADAYRLSPGSWHDGAKHEARCATMSTEQLTVNGIALEVLRHGAGTPVLLLHGMDTVPPQAPFLDLLDPDAE